MNNNTSKVYNTLTNKVYTFNFNNHYYSSNYGKRLATINKQLAETFIKSTEYRKSFSIRKEMYDPKLHDVVENFYDYGV